MTAWTITINISFHQDSGLNYSISRGSLKPLKRLINKEGGSPPGDHSVGCKISTGLQTRHFTFIQKDALSKSKIKYATCWTANSRNQTKLPHAECTFISQIWTLAGVNGTRVSYRLLLCIIHVWGPDVSGVTCSLCLSNLTLPTHLMSWTTPKNTQILLEKYNNKKVLQPNHVCEDSYQSSRWGQRGQIVWEDIYCKSNWRPPPLPWTGEEDYGLILVLSGYFKPYNLAAKKVALLT